MARPSELEIRLAASSGAVVRTCRATQRARQRLVGAAQITVMAASLLGACASPTEIRLRVHTNLPCNDPTQWKGVAIYAGEPGPKLEAKAPALTSTQCDAQGLVGTLVIVPSGAKDEEVGVRVVGGIASSPEECATHGYKGCIVARREVRFTRHEALDLDVALTSDCVGFGCDAEHTCISGTCTEMRSVPATPVTDAGPPSIAAGQPVVRCGDNGIFCPTTGNVCCLTVDRTAGTTSGECKDPALCPPSSIVLNCDDESDCSAFSDEQGPGVCAISYTRMTLNAPFIPHTISLSQCMSSSNFFATTNVGLGLCQTREQACLDGSFPCRESTGDPDNPLPGYFWCQLGT